MSDEGKQEKHTLSIAQIFQFEGASRLKNPRSNKQEAANVLKIGKEIKRRQRLAEKISKRIERMTRSLRNELFEVQQDIAKLNQLQMLATKKTFATFKELLEACFPEHTIVQDGASYYADEVKPENFIAKDEKNYFMNFTYHYCPHCGYVVGAAREQKFDDIELLSGSAGKHYFCSLCDRQIHTETFVQS